MWAVMMRINGGDMFRKHNLRTQSKEGNPE